MHIFQLTSGENLECFTDLTELIVCLSHVFSVLQGMVSDCKYAELLGDVLVAGVCAYSQRGIVVFTHIV